MSNRKGKHSRKSVRKNKISGNQKTEVFKTFAVLFILVSLSVLAGYIAHNLISSKIIPKDSSVKTVIKKKTVSKKKIISKKPVYEIYQEQKKRTHKTEIIKPDISPNISEKLPLVAIIIDDIGYDIGIAEKFLGLDATITLSILPYSTFNQRIGKMAREKGFEIMLHLPMEPDEYPAIKPGPGGILSSMSPDQLIAQLNNDINEIPYIKGVNNHMGSRITADSAQMNQVFSVLKKRNLFFIDSRTNRNTLCRSSAALFKVPFTERDVFLDHFHEPAFIKKQIQLLINIAQKKGTAVGIAHPDQQTYDVLKKALPELKKKVRLVSASEIIHATNK